MLRKEENVSGSNADQVWAITMAKRRTESLSATPALTLDTDLSSVCQVLFKNRRVRRLFSEESEGSSGCKGILSNRPKQSKRRPDSANYTSIPPRTRAQTRQLKLLRDRLPQTGHTGATQGRAAEQRLKDHHLHHPSPNPNPIPSSSTVATSSQLINQGRATRSRSELRLRDRLKIDTPDVSCNGDLGNKTEDDDINGNDPNDDNEDINEDGDDVNERGDEDRGGGGGEENLDNEDGAEFSENDGDDTNENPHEADMEGGGSEEEEEEITEEGGEDCEEEGCRCTSNWSCGGHSGLKRAGPCQSTPKLQKGGKRRLASVDEQTTEDSDVSPSKKGCRSASKTRQNSRSVSSSSVSSSSPICKTVRHRIPSREHPPPRLQQWLETFKSWGNAERMMALDDLITLCEPSQVRHMMHVIEPQFQRDFISLLPKELALHVLSYLDPKDLLQAAQTCCYWRVLCEDNLLWREKCREEGINEKLVYGSRLRRRPGQRSPCKALYMRQSQIEHNWRQGMSRAPKILKGHDDHVITCLEFCGQRIVSGSDDNTLKVWSVVTGKC
ncbi:hypothetical protein ACOMHN_033330 [Nucella lapillus]